MTSGQKKYVVEKSKPVVHRLFGALSVTKFYNFPRTKTASRLRFGAGDTSKWFYVV